MRIDRRMTPEARRLDRHRRMGYAMARAPRAEGGADVTVWNRTRAKAEPLAQYGAKIADKLADLAACDIVFVHGVDVGRREAR